MGFVDPSVVPARILRVFSGMTDGQLRRGEGFRRDNPQGFFIGESAKVISRALDASLKPLAVLGDDRWLAHDRPLIERIEGLYPTVPIIRTTPEEFTAITGYEVVRGALACFERPEPLDPKEVLEGARRVAILEDITNYANMGALFRSAAALGVDGVLLSPGCHDPYYRRCARVSMGAVFQVPWARLAESDFVPLLREAGFKTAALALRSHSLSLRDPQLKAAERLALALGTEGEGLRDSTIDACDFVVEIPMAHGVDSLNVAACGAIAFWELCS